MKTLKQTLGIYQKCVSWGTGMFVNKCHGAQKWKCENFTLISVFIPACRVVDANSHYYQVTRMILSALCVQHWSHALSHLWVPLSLAQTLVFHAKHCSTSTPAAIVFLHCLGHHQQICQTVCRDSLWYFVCVCDRASVYVCMCLYKAEKSTVCFLGANLTLWWQLFEKQVSHCEL